jgi:hypothetical protein
VTLPPGYPDRVPTPRPPQRPQEPPPGGYRLPTPAEVCRALLRRHAARMLARSSTALRATADALTRARWRLEDTTRNRAVGLSVVPGGYAQGRADLALTHRYPDRKAEAEEFWRQVDAGLIPRPPRTVHRPEGA